MTEPLRWKEPGSDASSELRALMKYARTRTPDAAQAAALTEAVLAQLPTSAPATLGTGALGSSSTKLIALAGAAALGAALGVIWYAAQPAAPQRPPAAQPSRAVSVLPPPTVPPSAPGQIERAEPELAPEPPALPAPVARRGEATRERGKRGSARPAPETRTSASDDARSAQRELELLHEARRARRTSAQAALTLLREHEQAFPESRFREEREALLIEQLQQIDPTEAAARRAEFERRYPQSAYRRGLSR
jgi:hypothetical protein